MSAPHKRPKGAPAPAGAAEQSFADTFRRRPARAPHGLVPGRRVWVTLGWTAAVSATVTLSAALAAGGVPAGEREVTAASAGDSVPAGDAGAPAGASASPSPSPSPTPAEEKKDGGEKKAEEEPAAVRPAAPVTVTAQARSDDEKEEKAAKDEGSEEEKESSGSSGSGSGSGGSGGTEKSTTTTKRTQDFSRPLGRISGLYDPFVGRCVQLVGSSLQSYGCDGGGDQNWQFASDGTLRKGGRCLSLAGRSTRDGTLVVMASCDSTDVTQWRYSGGNDIVNVAADKCLDVANAATSDGTPLQIAYCSGNAAQKWAVP